MTFPELELAEEEREFVEKNPMRVHMFLSGFQFLGDLMQNRTGSPARVVCKYITSEYSEEFSFDAIVRELAKVKRIRKLMGVKSWESVMLSLLGAKARFQE